MHIDNVAPTCEVPRDFSAWHWYFGEDARTITLSNISEQLDENRCKIYDKGREIKPVYSPENNEITFTLGKGWHNVGIVLTDVAGNAWHVSEQVNIHVGYFWLWFILGGLTLFILVIAILLMISSRARRRRENEY